MSILVYWVGVSVGLASACYLAAYLYVHKYRNIFKEMGVPFVKSSSWLGISKEALESGDFFKAEQDLVQKHGKFFGIFEGQLPVLMVADLDLIRQVLVKDFDSFVDRRPFGAPVRKRTMDFQLTLLNGSRWKHVRQQITPAFTPNALRRMNPLIWHSVRQLSKNVAKKADSGEDIDIKNFCSCYTMDVIASVAFGMDIDSLNDPDNEFVVICQKAFQGTVLEGSMLTFVKAIVMFPFLMKVFALLPNRELMKPFEFLQNVVEREIASRRQDASKNRPDFLGMVMHLEKDPNDPAFKDFLEYDEFGLPWLRNGLTKEEVIAQAVLFFLAGFETTANMLSYVLFALASNPDCQNRLFSDIDSAFSKIDPDDVLSLDSVHELRYLDMCINEALRLYTPVARLERKCTRATVLAGCNIPEGMTIAVAMNAIHHDPDVWENPEKYDPERFSPEQVDSRHQMAFLTFGFGNRNCIGMRLAYLELKLAVIKLVREFRFQVSENTVFPLKFKLSLLRTLENPILLKATRR